MSQGYLIEPMAYRKLEERLAPVPGTEEATGLAGVGGFIEGTMQDMELDAILCTECLEIRTVGFVRNVIHDDMRRLYLNMRLKNTRTLCK